MFRQGGQSTVGVDDHRKTPEDELIGVRVHDAPAREAVDDERSHAESVVVGFPVGDEGRNASRPVQKHGDGNLARAGGQAQDAGHHDRLAVLAPFEELLIR